MKAYQFRLYPNKEQEEKSTKPFSEFIYGENEKFVETRYMGDLDEFDEKQAEAFYNEILKWDSKNRIDEGVKYGHK